MNRYRIKIDTTHSGIEKYYVQYKGWIFWHDTFDYYKDCQSRVRFKTLQEAEKYIADRTIMSTIYKEYP